MGSQGHGRPSTVCWLQFDTGNYVTSWNPSFTTCTSTAVFQTESRVATVSGFDEAFLIFSIKHGQILIEEKPQHRSRQNPKSQAFSTVNHSNRRKTLLYFHHFAQNWAL